MHLLAVKPGEIADGSAPVLLAQTPAPILLLSAADTELACFAAARAGLPATAPALRLANLRALNHHVSIDHYLDHVMRHAKLILVRLLGGRNYWPYGVECLSVLARTRGIRLALLAGDERFDEELAGLSNIPADALAQLHAYCREGGVDNAREALRFAASLIGHPEDAPKPPALLPRAGLYWPGLSTPDLAALQTRWPSAVQPVALIGFYRALVQAGDLGPIDALIQALSGRGFKPLPFFLPSLKDPDAVRFLRGLIEETKPAIILNATGFAAAISGAGGSPFDRADCVVLQLVLSGGTREAWASGTRGLGPSDIAMNVALPEFDGRVLGRAISFKSPARFDALTECALVRHRPEPDRIDFVAALAHAWARLRETRPQNRRVGLMLANYPNREGRIGNGVGLDTPASALGLLRVLQQAGYGVVGLPETGDALIVALCEGPTNRRRDGAGRLVREHLPLETYQAFFAALPEALQSAVTERWGAPEADPAFLPEASAFAIAARRYGKVAVLIQPARGYDLDPLRTYHDPALVPPHGYFAHYLWLRESFGALALIQMGKHGNLEWLPGKALALSANCYPEVALGPLPVIYPFIVNDPGEGTQAKRRSSAVIIDHLMPPLTRADLYGALGGLEARIDEYYEAGQLDPRRLKPLARDIIELARSLSLDRDCDVKPDDSETTALEKLDAYLCALKDLQIRGGLHVFGAVPTGKARTDTLAALVRLPRGAGAGEASLLRALADDLALGFDPLDTDLAPPWTGPRPACLSSVLGANWRSAGDTIERLDALARALIAGEVEPEPAWQRTRAVLGSISTTIAPALDRSGAAELAATLAALGGRFITPGPSGAPSRGRTDVLPTGRNFYALDPRAAPTPAAYRLGFDSAARLCEDHAQRTGDYPRRIALSAWGTANMRTGGDDIAQALALIGVRPQWERGSGRVSGFEIMPVGILGRPRVDVTLRVSGFFRDAFPGLIDLFDSATRAVAALDESAEDNPLAAQSGLDRARLIARGLTPGEAGRQAAIRVFGSKPGAYGAGLQALIDSGAWESETMLADAYLAWGAYAYGGGAAGEPARALFEARLGALDATVQNQDNREHDLLDSDDYYQFEGGLAVAAHVLSGKRPVQYHNDHSNPERPRIQTLAEEIGRIVRARAANPKWLAGVMRHGYKGAFEIAATVDYLFAFAATTDAVHSDQFEALYAAYLADEQVRDFMAQHNPAALVEMAERFEEAVRRNYWSPRANEASSLLATLARGRGSPP